MERPRKYPTNPSATVTSPSQFMGLKPRAKSNQMKESWRIRDCSMEEAFQPIYRCSQIATRVPFIFFAEKVCVENVLSREKIRQNLRSLRRKNRSRNPAVLLPDLLFVFGESLFSLTKNSEIHIDDEASSELGSASWCLVAMTNFPTLSTNVWGSLASARHDTASSALRSSLSLAFGSYTTS